MRSRRPRRQRQQQRSRDLSEAAEQYATRFAAGAEEVCAYAKAAAGKASKAGEPAAAAFLISAQRWLAGSRERRAKAAGAKNAVSVARGLKNAALATSWLLTPSDPDWATRAGAAEASQDYLEWRAKTTTMRLGGRD